METFILRCFILNFRKSSQGPDILNPSDDPMLDLLTLAGTARRMALANK